MPFLIYASGNTEMNLSDSCFYPLHRLRKQAGLSQEQVAVKLQVMGLPVSREIISQMELGRYSIRVSVLIALKQIYGVSYEEFFQGLPDSR